MRARGFVCTYIQLSVARSRVLTAVFLRIQVLTGMWPRVAKSAVSSPGKDHTVHGDCLPAYDTGTRFLLNVWRHQKHSVTSPEDPKALNKTSRIINRVNLKWCKTFRGLFLPPSSGGWGCKRTLCLCVFEKNTVDVTMKNEFFLNMARLIFLNNYM